MKRLRLRVSHRDAALVVAQGATKRSYKPFAHAFGAAANSNAALVVKAVNCHNHLVKAMQSIQRTAQSPLNGNGARSRMRLSLVGRIAQTALSKLED